MANPFRVPTPAKPLLEVVLEDNRSKARDHNYRADLALLDQINARAAPTIITSENTHDIVSMTPMVPKSMLTPHTPSGQHPTTPGRLRNPFSLLWGYLPTPKAPTADENSLTPPVGRQNGQPTGGPQSPDDAFDGSGYGSVSKLSFTSSSGDPRDDGPVTIGQKSSGALAPAPSIRPSTASTGLSESKTTSFRSSQTTTPASPMPTNYDNCEVQVLVAKCSEYENKVKALHNQAERLSFSLNKALAQQRDSDPSDEKHQRELGVLQQRLTEQDHALEERDQELEEAIQKLDIMEEEHQKDIHAMESHYIEALSGKDSEIAELRARTATGQSTGGGQSEDASVEQMRQTILEQTRTIEGLNNELNELLNEDEERVQQANDAIAEAEEDQLKAERELAGKCEEVKKLQQELIDKEADIQAMKLERINLVGKGQKDKKSLEEQVAPLKAGLEASQQRVKELEGVVADLEERLRRSEAELASSEQEHERERRAVEAERDAIEAERSGLEEERDSLRSERDSLQSKVASITQTAAEKQSEIAALRLEFGRAMQSATEALEKRNVEFAALERAVDDGGNSAEARINALNSVIAGRDGQIERLRSDLDGALMERNRLEEAVERLQGDVEDLEQEAESRKSDVQEREEEVEGLLREIESRDQDIKDLKSEVESLADEADGSAKKMNDRDAAVDELRRAKEAAEAEVSRLGDELSEQKSKVDELEAEVKALEDGFDEMESDVQEMESRIHELEGQLAEARRGEPGDDDGVVERGEVERLTRECDELRAEVEALRARPGDEAEAGAESGGEGKDDAVPEPHRNGIAADTTEAASAEEEREEVAVATAKLAAQRHHHALQLRGLSRQMAVLRALLAREERHRLGLVFEKKYLTMRVEMYDECNVRNLRLLGEILGTEGEEEEAGMGRNRGWADPGVVERGRCRERGGGSVTATTEMVMATAPSIRTVGLAVVAIHRMRRWSVSWAGVRRVHDSLVRKLADKKSRMVAVGEGV